MPLMRKPWMLLLAALAGLALAGAAAAQRLPLTAGQGPLGQVLGDVRSDVGAATRDVTGDVRALGDDALDLSQARLDSLRLGASLSRKLRSRTRAAQCR